MQQREHLDPLMILLDGRGRFGIAHNTPRMAWAYRNTEREQSGIKVQAAV